MYHVHKMMFHIAPCDGIRLHHTPQHNVLRMLISYHVISSSGELALTHQRERERIEREQWQQHMMTKVCA